MSPVHAASAEVDLQTQAPEEEKGTLAPPATIAELWSMFDVAAAHATEIEAGQFRMVQTQSPTERRYAQWAADGSSRYIALVPLVPTTRGAASCGAYVATSDSGQAVYVEPAPDHAWTVVTSGSPLDAAAVRSLFERVFKA